MFTRRPTDDQLGLLAVDLGGAATPLDRDLVSDRLRIFGGGEAAWEDGRRALFTLAPERLPAGESAADNVLGAALAVRELLLTPVAIACDVLPGSAGDAVRWLVPRRLMARVREHPGALVVTKAIAECRAARDVPFEGIPGTVEALSVVRPGARARIAPLGRWVVPLGPEDWERRSATGALLGRPWIEDGLLRPERVDDKLDASELLRAETPLVAVVAPAWTGKTHLVGALSDAIARTGTPSHVTSLEHPEGGHTHWPDQAFLRASGERVWLVDALDEGVARQVNLGKLQKAGAHDGLRTIITTRSDERAFEVLSKLSVPRSTYVLLPLDRKAVLRDVCEGDASRLDKLLAMARHMRLEHPLSFAEWQELDRQVQHGGEPDRRTLLGALLDRRCERLRRGRVRELPAGMSRAARWLAAAAAATGEQRFTFGAGSGLDVLRVVPDDLRDAAQALRDTVVLARTGGPSGEEWAFAAAHLGEDLAAAFFAETGTLERLGAQRLRRLLTDGVQPWPDLARLIARADELTGGDLSRRLAPMPAEAKAALDALFDVARNAGDEILWGLGRDDLAYLGQALTSDYARERLFEPTATRSSRHLALRLARAAGWNDLAPEAVAIARDGGEDVELREMAVSLAVAASALPDLEPLVDAIERDGGDPDLSNLRATLLRRMLEQGRITPAAAIPRASAAEEHHVDERKRLLTTLRDSLDLEAARLVIDEVRRATLPSLKREVRDVLAAVPALPPAIAPEVRRELAPAAARLLLSTPLLAPVDLDRAAFVAVCPDSFASLMGGESVYDQLRDVAARNTGVRRGLYERLEIRGIPSLYVGPLQCEDAEWLIDIAGRLAMRSKQVQRELHWMAHRLRRESQEELATRGEALLRADGVWDELEQQADAGRRAMEELERESAARRAERQQAIERTLHLAELVPRLLEDDREPSVRLHVLGDFVFGERRARRNVVGSFDDLGVETQNALIDAARAALTEATPRELPRDGESFSSTLLDEAAAFRAVATWRRDPGWLDAALVRTWLPVALFVGSGGTSEMLHVVDHCYEAAPEETIAGLVDSLRREAPRGHAHVHYVPERVRRDRRTAAAIEPLVDELASTVADSGAGALTEILELYLEAEAPAARERALFERLTAHPNLRVARAAAGAWLTRRPAEGFTAAQRLIVDEASAAEVLAPILDDRWATPTPEWPAEALAAMAQRLAETVRAEDDEPEPRGAHFVSTREQLQDLREVLISRCEARHDEPVVRAALDAIATVSPRHERMVQRNRIRNRLRRATEDARLRRLTAREAAEHLRAGMRSLADEADLAMAVREVLEEEWDPTWHLLLFDAEGERRNEKAVQALVHLLLTQRLDRATTPAATATIREPLNRGDDEPDFEVRAGTQLAVPIEVKWDDHKDWRKALRTQLAQRYCKTRRHGVYVVATADRDPASIGADLMEDADAVAHELGVTIHIVVQDVREGRPKAKPPKPAAKAGQKPASSPSTDGPAKPRRKRRG